MDGWIKLHRKIIEWEWYQDNTTLKVFIHCLFLANHKDKKWKGILIKKGSFITSRKNFAKGCGLSVQQVRTSWDKLKSTSEITSETSSQYTIITINNWDEYQQSNQQSNQRVTSDQPASNQRVTTTNNDKNEKKEKKRERGGPGTPKPLLLYLEEFNRLYGREFRETTGRERKLAVRLKSYSIDDILKALRTMASQAWTRGDNKMNWVATPDYLIRSDEVVDKFLNDPEQAKRKGVTEDDDPLLKQFLEMEKNRR